MAKKRAAQKKSLRTDNGAAGDKPVGESRKTEKKRPFPIVGLGASAGGLDALKAFFQAVPETSGMAYIVVVHMTPKQPSVMPELLQKVTKIPASAAQDGQAIEPNHVYVLPPDKDISVYQGRIQLLDMVRKGVAHPIDFFLRSLAQDQGEMSAAVILSGTGTDGTLGIKEIKACEGVVLAESEQSAKYDGMPRSAIGTGTVDMILRPEEMPEKLIHYFSHVPGHIDKGQALQDEDANWLNKIFAILRAQLGHDFSYYKSNTILRRINRRMGLNRIDEHGTYVRFLRENPNEVDTLFRELLIGVTSFFRDAESFEVLKKDVLPQMLNNMPEDATFRAWIPGCATGEEVYSLAMVLRECLDTASRRITLQLFGTDIDKYAIDKAREGIFPVSISADLNGKRLSRFFLKEGDTYRIRRELRDTVIFSVQDVMKDPPFSRINLLCCRNLLIYLNGNAQKSLLPLFHYTLVPEGVLMLGSSETIGGFTNLFKTLDKKWKVFRRREVPRDLRHMVHFPSGSTREKAADKDLSGVPLPKRTDITQLTQQAVLDRFAPTAILIDTRGDILNVQGRTGKYLETPSGSPTNNILDLAREGLRIELSAALRAAKGDGKRVTRRRLSVKTNGDVQVIDLHVSPLHAPRELAGRFLVVFEDVDVPLPVEQEVSGDIGFALHNMAQEKHRRAAEEALSESEAKFKGLVNNLNVGVYRNTPDPRGKFIEVNPAMVEMFGYETREEVMARSESDFYMNPADREGFIEKLLTHGSVKNEALELKKKDGTLLIGSVSAVAVPDEKGNTKYVDNIVEDITHARQLQAELQQAQKMESVGRLAGGVAHDFNNKLTTMLGYTELATGRLDPSDALYGDLKQVLEAGKQSTNIVRQLLAFARKQTISPEVMHLNDTVEQMLKMLRRLIGEDLDLAWEPGADLWLINMDPTQLDQILANLCVNAKDAIGGVGKVTIETENVVLDEAYCAQHAGFVPGEYVMLAVSDDGVGMDKETLENVFEPFFTTKEVGKGTGLGLSTVYGIVKQNHGFVNMYSEPGRGTTVKIYLPRHEGEAEGKGEAIESEIPRGHGETVLIVEDEKTVLELGKQMLEQLGYTVMATQSPVEAVGMVREHTGDIHLLMTDVVMPRMSGKELAEEIQKIRPDIKTLFMSGYTANAIAHQGVLDEGVHFIQKPFGMESLARKVREVLNAD